MLSGNRNFEGRVHPQTRANYLASPPLVVAYALAGRCDIDFKTEPIGKGKDGKDVFLSDIWPTREEVQAVANGKEMREEYMAPLNPLVSEYIPRTRAFMEELVEAGKAEELPAPHPAAAEAFKLDAAAQQKLHRAICAKLPAIARRTLESDHDAPHEPLEALLEALAIVGPPL